MQDQHETNRVVFLSLKNIKYLLYFRNLDIRVRSLVQDGVDDGKGRLWHRPASILLMKWKPLHQFTSLLDKTAEEMISAHGSYTITIAMNACRIMKMILPNPI